MAKKTFICYLDRIDYAESMSDKELWMLFRKILQHENEKEEIILPLEYKFAREKIRKQLDQNTQKRIDKSKKRSEAWKKWWSNHVWNQYTTGDEKRKANDKAQKKPVEAMETMEANGSMTDTKTYNNSFNKSSKKEERNIKKEEMEKMLESFRKDERLVRFMNEEDVIRWWEYKQSSKKPYKDISSFITALVKIKNVIKDYWWMPKADRNRRNRFNFAVNEAIERKREWLNWYDSMEQVYESSKNDLYPNPKQNE